MSRENEAQEAVKSVYVSPAVKRYCVELTDQTRQHPDVYLGASPRGSLTLFRASQARAAMAGRDYVLPDDVKVLALPALAHRVIVSPRARLREISSANIIEEVLGEVPVPAGNLSVED